MSAKVVAGGNEKWEAVIGLEVHVQLATNSKAFSGSAVQYGASPNSLTDPTVLALPGALPVFNEEGLRLAMRLGLALGCTIAKHSRFARKHYFYPDQPAGYQISQYDEPICEGGFVPILEEGVRKNIALTRIHLENDAGKNNHVGPRSLVDLNRAGVTLCEVVSEPVLRSAREAADYMRSLRQIVRYLGVSEGDMEKGQLRCDANVSIRPRGEDTLGTRSELKNINSFKFVHQAIDHEIARQICVIESGERVVLETRLWDADAGISRSMRGKEEALDYRYFPDPDLPPLEVSDETIESIRSALPELPLDARERLMGLGLSADDAAQLSSECSMLEYYDATLAHAGDVKHAKLAANWICAELLGELKRLEKGIGESPLEPARLAGLLRLIADDTISGKIAKGILPKMLESQEEARDIVEREGLGQITDTGALEAVVDELLAKNPKQVQGYRGGNQKLLGFFVGQVMKATGGKAKPQVVNELLRAKLGAE
ncbi:MAG: Asp-tRNA(Asn)/Glu-tRNA(Gln) amidotransferase subunit GatB [Myxococcales bacterium]|nr:Asp-tRNA(Asn)/Glu-tRNA(Gln) amidotransferase subunit GatB [Myxococcales bacterium]